MLSARTYERLCGKLNERDPKGIEELYDIYGDALYGIIVRIVSDEGVATEILQDTFVKAWQNGDSYNPQLGRLYTWLLRIARNLSINYVNSKRSKQNKKIQPGDNLVYLSDHKKGVEAMESCDLQGNVSKLEDKYRKVVELIYYQGYTHVEVSETLELPIGTVKSRIKIALRKLKEAYNFRLSTAPISVIVLLSILL